MPAETNGVAVPGNHKIHKCEHCGEECPSRNALFKHLAAKCDPLAAKVKEGKERILFCVGYLGSRYRCSALQNDRDEALQRSVEGALLEALRTAQLEPLGVVRGARTERGFHAAENVIIVTVKPCVLNEEDLRDALAATELRLLSSPKVLAEKPQSSIFEKIYAPRRKTFAVHIPYFALITRSEREVWCGDVPPLGGLWFGPVHDACSVEEVLELLQSLKVNVSAKDVDFEKGRGHVQVRMSDEKATEQALQRLQGLEWYGNVLSAAPLSEALAKFEVHRRVRSALKELKGGPCARKGLRSYHNFMSPSPAFRDTCAMRQLLHCSAMGLQTQRRTGPGGPWIHGDWTAIFFAATDFGPQQVRRMAGALVATTRQSEPLGYIAQCFEAAALLAPAVPSECVALDSLELGACDANWRRAAQVDEAEAAAMRKAIEERVRTEALEPWKEFLQLLDCGSTRSLQRLELFQAAENGDVDAVQKALRLGAPVNAANEYGQSAVFLAAVAGAVEVLRFLAASDADFTRCDNAGISPCQAAAFCGRRAALEEMAEVAAVKLEATRLLAARPPAVPAVPVVSSVVSAVIPEGVQHPGAGTVVIDGAFEEEILLRLGSLWQKLPLAPKEKASPTERAYFDDVEGWMTGALNAAVRSAKLNDADSTVSRVRFLIYPHPGGSLPAHVDLPRYDKNGLRSTYTFLLYLSDCISGGETTFLESLEGDVLLAPSGGVAPGQRETLGAVSPKRGRLLLMPHACPHLAAPVVEVPKVLVRGEVMPPPSVESAPRTFATCDGASTSLEEVAPGVTSRWKSAKKTVLMGSKEKC